MRVKRLTMKSAALAGLMLTGLSGCATSPSGAAQARIDAMQPHIGPCAGSLAGDGMKEARRDCTPLVIIADGA